MQADIRTAKGTYLLLAQLKHGQTTQVGKLGRIRFAAGWYAYAGSALGPGGLLARLARHTRRDKRLHWHVDYLMQHAQIETVWQAAYPKKLECAWAAAIQGLPGAQTPVPGFGASDCRCTTHLIYLPRRPNDPQITAALSAWSPAEAEICCTPWPAV